jgi:NAD(P)-dependent dehydrogenase (short-subunit alcohol dehydrogenase family)
MNLELDGKVALVCGASQGLGLAIGEALAAEGCRVGLLARNGDKLLRHVAALKGRGRAVALPRRLVPRWRRHWLKCAIFALRIWSQHRRTHDRCDENRAVLWLRQFEPWC